MRWAYLLSCSKLIDSWAFIASKWMDVGSINMYAVNLKIFMNSKFDMLFGKECLTACGSTWPNRHGCLLHEVHEDYLLLSANFYEFLCCQESIIYLRVGCHLLFSKFLLFIYFRSWFEWHIDGPNGNQNINLLGWNGSSAACMLVIKYKLFHVLYIWSSQW